MAKIAKVKEDNRYMQPSEAAIRLNLHYTTVLKAMHRGDLRYMQTPGGFRRVLRSDVEAMYARMYGAAESQEEDDDAGDDAE